MTKEEKLKQVNILLNAIKGIIVDHLDDDYSLDIPAIDLIKGSIEVYEEMNDEEL